MTDMRVFPAQANIARASADNAGFVAARATRDGSLFTADWIMALALEGRVFIAGDGDANDRVTGQTSFADTTPTFLLDVPSGKAVIPLSIYLGQAGTVAGGAIDVNIAVSPTATAYASGGTAETIMCARVDAPLGAPSSVVHSGATATASRLTKQIRSWTLGQDVSPAEGAVQEVIWTPDKQGHPIILVGPCSLGIFTYAGTTGPTWNWSISFVELPSTAVA